MKGNMQSSGMSSGNIFVNLSQYFFLIAIFLVVIILMGITALVFKKKRQMIIDKLTKIKNDFIFNGMIKSLNFSYLGICIALSASLQASEMQDDQTQAKRITNLVINIALTLVLFIIPFFIATVALMNHEKFKEL